MSVRCEVGGPLVTTASYIGNFLSSIGPDLFVMFVALLLGIPFALWTDRRLKKREERAEITANKERLVRGLNVLETALRYNRRRFDYLTQTFAGGVVEFDPALDLSAWEACITEVVPLLHDADLRRRLAFHFSRLEALAKVHNRALNLAVGMESTLMNAQNTRTRLKPYLLATMEALDGEAASLITALAEAKEVYGSASKD